MIFKFGDKVQVVDMDEEDWKQNLFSGTDGEIIDGDIRLGDVGVVVTSYSDKTVVAFEDLDDLYNVDNKCLAKHNASSIKKYQTRLKELKTIKGGKKSYPGFAYHIEYHEQTIKVGCQTISKANALLIAADINKHFKGK